MNELQKGDRKWNIIITTIVIMMLILGYIPLSDFLFRKHFTIHYNISVGNQYDVPGGETTPAKTADVIFLDEEGNVILNGLVLEKRYTELILDTQGVLPHSIDLTGEYKGEPEQLLIHIGAICQEDIYSSPLFLKSIEEGGWHCLNEGGISLYQRDNRFQSLSEFFSYAENPNEEIGLAGIEPGKVLSYSLAGRKTSEKELLGMPLRGPHILDLIVNTNSLHIKLSKRDLNWYAGADDVSVSLKKGGFSIYQIILPDDGDILDDHHLSSKKQPVDIELKDIEPGLYTLEISSLLGNNDFVIDGIKTDAVKAVIKDSIFLFDPSVMCANPRIPSTTSAKLYLNSPAGVLSAETWHPFVQRSISEGNRKLLAFEAKESPDQILKGSVIMQEGKRQLDIDNPGSLILKYYGGGFSFSPDDLFNPSFSHFLPLQDSTSENLSFILANDYQSPEEIDGVRLFTRCIPLKGHSFPGEKIKIVLEKIGSEEIVLTSLKIVLNRR